MKTHSYTVHLSLNASDDGMVIIKEGFCWSSFFLTVPWALFHCMWLESAIFATIQVAIVIIFQFAMLSVTALGIALFAVALVFGFMADEIRQNFLLRKGYRFEDLVLERDMESATKRVLTARSQLLARMTANL
ncbi:MAG: hypothetical protein CMF71_07890 [Magnetovibrio sp.]|nr:hypothetical protein [Magnetovibrio sp.]MBH90129.1 hypothetical protein [Magnetovibrio sp.]|tara:strand:+ start:1839 stop:2237 length:399 start_codon:yes stop_codon:yes gene_type:complete